MDDVIKICPTHGNLTEDQIRRRKPPRKEIICKKCDCTRQKKLKEKNPEKYSKHALKFRYIQRAQNLKELKCSHCKKIKSVDLFFKFMEKIRYPYCKECSKQSTKVYRDHPETKKKVIEHRLKTYDYSLKSHLKTKYNMQLEHFKELEKIQNGVCAICKNPPVQREVKWVAKIRLHVDHDHITGKVRALLCYNCNQGLGQFKDNIENLKKAVEYLEFHQNKL